MQAKTSRACQKGIQELENYLKCIGAGLHDELYLDCTLSKDCAEILAVDKSIKHYVRLLGGSTYTYGVHVARYCDGRLVLNLGLLQVINKIANHYVKTSNRGEKLFLYGRDLLEESIIELRINKNCGKQPLVVLNERGEPIGFGRASLRKGRIIIENVIDLGWYLRSGV